MALTTTERDAIKRERARRRAVLAQATAAGFWSGRGDECAILCTDCTTPMLILARRGDVREVRCLPCGRKRFMG